MPKIVVIYQPFSLLQQVSALDEEGQMMETMSVPIDIVNATIKGLASKYEIVDVLLHGNDNYVKKFQADLMNEFSEFKVQII